MTMKIVLAAALGLVFVLQAQSASIREFLELQPAIPIKPLNAGPIFHDCSKSTDKFKLKNVLVKGCTALPCILKKGTNVSVEIDFESEEVTPTVTAKVYGQIGPAKVPFPISQPDACKCGVECPTKSGTSYKYNYLLPVLSSYPNLELAVYWYLYDQNGEALCMDVLVKIES